MILYFIIHSFIHLFTNLFMAIVSTNLLISRVSVCPNRFLINHIKGVLLSESREFGSAPHCNNRNTANKSPISKYKLFYLMSFPHQLNRAIQDSRIDHNIVQLFLIHPT